MIPGHVNIVIPLYNLETYIEKCVSSALAQTYSNFSVTVINDASTDYSRPILQEFVDKWNGTEREKIATKEDGCWDFCGKLKIIDNSINKGLSESRNIGIRSNDAEFFVPLDADDWIAPDYLEKTIPLMRDPQVGIVATGMQYEGLLHNYIAPGGLTLESEMQSNNLPVTSLVRRSAFDQTKGYETLFIEVAGKTRAPGFEDWEIWISILKRGWKVATVAEGLFHHVIRPHSMISEATKCQDGLIRLIHLLHPDLWPNP